jgi:hypothetical protein
MTSVVIPVAVEPVNFTLPLALASIATHAPWLNPVLIGEPIQLEPYTVPYTKELGPIRVLPFMTQGLDPAVNTNAMLRAALMDEEITDPFVWSNDDIYFLRETSLDDIRVAGATARKKLEDNPPTGRYGTQSHHTAAVLRGLSKPTWDYERHVPIVVNKDRMRLALAFGPTAYPRSMYQNLQFEKPAFVQRDVKAFATADLAPLARDGQFFSTGNRIDAGDIRRVLKL